MTCLSCSNYRWTPEAGACALALGDFPVGGPDCPGWDYLPGSDEDEDQYADLEDT